MEGVEPGWSLFSQGLLQQSQNTKSVVLYKHLFPTLWMDCGRAWMEGRSLEAFQSGSAAAESEHKERSII